jgi:hypothetical protein
VDCEERVLSHLANGGPTELPITPRTDVCHGKARVRDPLKSPGVFRHRAEQYIEAAASGVDKRISQVPLSQRA